MLLLIPLVVKGPKMATGSTNGPYLFCFTHAAFGLVWFPPTLRTAVNPGCIQSYIVATYYFYFFIYIYIFCLIVLCFLMNLVLWFSAVASLSLHQPSFSTFLLIMCALGGRLEHVAPSVGQIGGWTGWQIWLGIFLYLHAGAACLSFVCM